MQMAISNIVSWLLHHQLKVGDIVDQNIAVDETFLKCKYDGTLLTAATMDGNSKIFPLAVSI